MLSNIAVSVRLLVADKKAVTAIEYALIAALIAVAIIGAVSTMGANIGSTFGSVASEL
jgi:pilus assembly protein Flp/PilA